MSTVGKKVTKGVGWVTVSSFGSQGVRLLVKLILARVLLPEHYGLIGMAYVVTNLVRLIGEFGMGAALIQKNEKDINEIHFNTVFWINLIISLVGYLLITFALTPLAAWFYEESFLYKLIPVISISLIIDSFYLVHRSKLTKKMDFKPQAIIEIIAIFFAGITAVILALRGFGVWSLAFNGIITSSLSLVGYYVYLKWLPSFQFSIQAFKELFNFGGFVLIQNIFHFITQNIDYILIGKLVGSSALGIYTLAFILTDTIRKKTMHTFSKVLFPAFSTFQDEHDRIKNHYLSMVNITSCILVPVMVIFIFFARPIISWGFGDEWLNAIIPLQLLSAAMIVEAIFGTVAPVLKGIGRADVIVKVSVVNTFLVAIPSISIGSFYFGINGAAAAVLVYKLVGNLLFQYHLHRLLSINFLEVVKNFIKPLVVSVFVGWFSIILINNFSLGFLLDLIIGISIFLTIYSFYIWFIEKPLVNKFLSILKK